tara:strand:- start:574 stop:735 length:162 start_codon:yes stop_codon:yes gene_type:complete
MKFKVYNKNSEEKDVIMLFNADSIERAIAFASGIKQMDTKQFLKIFKVVEVDE